MALMSLTEWVEGTDVSPPMWVNGDWKAVMNLLSRLLVDPLNKRKQHFGLDDSTFKIAFNSEMSEAVLGIPFVVVEADLLPLSEAVCLALLSAMICIKNSTQIEPDGKESDVANPHYTCLRHVYFTERVIAQKQVYHRICFICSECGELLHRFSYRDQMGILVCYKHLPYSLLVKKWSKNRLRILKNPCPLPKPVSIRNQRDGLFFNGNERSEKLKGMENNFFESRDGKLCFISQSREIGVTINTSRETMVSTDSSETCPIPPPKPKRKNLLQQFRQFSTPSSALGDSTSETRISTSSMEDGLLPNTVILRTDLATFPGSPNPLDPDVEDSISNKDDYDKCLNPFEIHNDVNKYTSNSMAKWNHPKSRPPPPPPPKPPLVMWSPLTELSSRSSSDNRAVFLYVVSLKETVGEAKSHSCVGKDLQEDLINFTEEKYDNLSLNSINEILNVLDKRLDLIEMEGKALKKELLVIVAQSMSQDSSDWQKDERVSQWMNAFEKHCILLRQQTICVKKFVLLEYFFFFAVDGWRNFWMKFSRKELELRHLIESEREKDPCEVEREAELLELLIDIIGQKSLLVGSKLLRSDLVIKYASLFDTRMDMIKPTK
uniref:LIM zinc-binding domain-containing protein n=1 Tax=Setaria digitata TaxID=48799 RepID=A0A915PY56_9BILA